MGSLFLKQSLEHEVRRFFFLKTLIQGKMRENSPMSEESLEAKQQLWTNEASGASVKGFSYIQISREFVN